MRTREKNFLDIEKMKTVYSFQVWWKGKWAFPSKDGNLQKFETKAECDSARAEYRKRKDL